MESAYGSRTDESWKPIDDFPYEVSSFGRIRSTESLFGLRIGSEVSIYTAGQPYPCVFLYKTDCKTRHQLRVHRLVAAAFLGQCPTGMEVNHKDHDKHNSCADNLEYVTSSENKLEAVKAGAFPLGERRWNARLTADKVARIWELAADGVRRADIAAQLGASESSVHHVLDRRNWKHLAPPEVAND